MYRRALSALPIRLSLPLVLALCVPVAHAFDAEAAQVLARQNNCFKCHSVEKKKEGPSFKDTAARLKGKPEAQDRIVKHLTTGEMAKFPDGHEEEHKIINAKDEAAVRNLADWILSQ